MIGAGPLERIVGAYRAAFAHLPRPVWILAAASLVNRSGTMVLPFLTLYLTQRLGFTLGEAGRTLSLYGVGSAAGALLGGWLADRVGPVRVQIGSLLGTGLGFLILGSLRSRPAVALSVLVVSVVAESFRPASFAAAAAASPEEVRTRSLALLRLAANLGMSVGPVVGGLLAVHHYGLLFVVDAATCWVAALVLAAFLRGLSLTRAAAGGWEERRAPWRDGPFLVFLMLVFLLATVFYQIFSTLPVYLRSHFGLAEDGIGLILAVNTVIIVLFEMVLLRRIEHLDLLRVAALGSFLVCLGFAVMPISGAAVWAPLTVVVWTLGEMLSLPITNSLAAARAAGSGGGRFLGAYLLAFSLAFVAGPAAGTALYEALGPTALWAAVGGVGLVLAAGFLLLAAAHRSGRRPWAAGRGQS